MFRNVMVDIQRPMDNTDNCNTIQEEHPAMRIPEILEHILTNCDLRTLKSCRQVSKFWHQTCSKPWRTLAFVKFYAENKTLDVTDQHKSISDFLELLDRNNSDDAGNWYPNVTLHSIHVNDTAILRAFWRICGPQIRSITLRNCVFPSHNAIRKVLFKYCPIMEHLGLSYCTVNNGKKHGPLKLQENSNLKSITILNRNHSGVRISWLELFGGLPQLKVLTFPDYGSHATIEEVFAAINTICRDNPSALKLERLVATTIHPPSDDTIPISLYRYLKSPEIEIKYLSFGVYGKNCELELRGILAAQGATLKSLRIERSTYRLDPAQCFPATIRNQPSGYLINLQEFSVRPTALKNMEFLKFMPNLKKLSIFSVGPSRTVTHMVSDTKCDRMTNVKLDSCLELGTDHFIGAHELLELMKWLPNVERLNIGVNNESFALVCQHWSHMKVMDIVWNGLKECDFIGLDEEHVKMINLEREVRPGMPATVQNANISCLKNLQSLTLKNREEGLYISLGYAAVAFGIKRLPCLNYLQLWNISVEQEEPLDLFSKYQKRYGNHTFHEIYERISA